MPRSTLSAAEARRIALAAQGFATPRPTAAVNAGHVRRVVERLGLMQLDFVNVLLPAHQLVPFSRLGAYPPEAFQRAIYDSGRFTEQWAHEASIVPTHHWPLLGYRRRRYRPWPGSPLLKLRNYRKYLAQVLDIVKETGAVTSTDIPVVDGPKRRPGDWHRSPARWALEYHFGCGNLAVVTRLANFQRVYDLPQRVLPAAHLDRRVDDASALRELLAGAAAASGIATARDLADYYRMTLKEVTPRLEELAEAGVVHSVQVEGWQEPGWLHDAARIPRRVSASALLSPFDPLVWFRPRAERLFDFHYRIEIYVPEARRRWGYYVLPYLCDDRLAARVDLKAARAERVLQVRAAYQEPGIERASTAARLAAELHDLAGWLGLDRVSVSRKGDFAAPLAAAVRAIARA